MSYNYMPRMKDLWLPAMTAELSRRAELAYSIEQVFASNDNFSPLLSAFATTDPDYGPYMFSEDPDRHGKSNDRPLHSVRWPWRARQDVPPLRLRLQ